MARKVGTYYRDARGRFASKNTPGAIEFTSKSGKKKKLSEKQTKKLKEVQKRKKAPKPVKVETSLAKKRKEKKLERLRQYESLKAKAELAGQYYGKSVNSTQDAKTLGVAKGSQLGYGQLKKIRDERDAMGARVAPAKRFKQERFKSGEPLSDEQMRKPLSDADVAKLGAKGKLLTPSEARTDDTRARAKELQQSYKAVKKIAPDLTEAEFKTIRDYTRGSGYIAPNAAARGMFKDPNSTQAREAVTQARLIDSALSKLPDYQGTVRRDTTLPVSEFSRYAQGERIKLYGVTSTTSDLSGKYTRAYGNESLSTYSTVAKQSDKSAKYSKVADELGIKTPPSGDSVRVEYKMNVTSGKSIKQLSVEAGESEIALRHGWSGIVRKVVQLGDNYYRVEVDE